MDNPLLIQKQNKSKKCEEGWNGVSGLKATLKVGDLEAYTKKFNV